MIPVPNKDEKRKRKRIPIEKKEVKRRRSDQAKAEKVTTDRPVAAVSATVVVATDQVAVATVDGPQWQGGRRR